MSSLHPLRILDTKPFGHVLHCPACLDADGSCIYTRESPLVPAWSFPFGRWLPARPFRPGGWCLGPLGIPPMSLADSMICSLACGKHSLRPATCVRQCMSDVRQHHIGIQQSGACLIQTASHGNSAVHAEAGLDRHSRPCMVHHQFTAARAARAAAACATAVPPCLSRLTSTQRPYRAASAAAVDEMAANHAGQQQGCTSHKSPGPGRSHS